MAKSHGGHRANSGRKPRANEEELKTLIEEALNSAYGSKDGLTQLWRSIAKEAKEGDKIQQERIVNYYYGKPKQIIEADLNANIVLFQEEE